MDLGPFAAENIEDLNPDLAAVSMKLDSSLQHDGNVEAEDFSIRSNSQ
jgi:hypothetical protein